MDDSVLVMIEGPERPRPRPADALRIVDAMVGQVRVNDLGVTRGDGIFEVAGSLDGRVQALQAHLDRFSRSARLMDLPAPDHEVYRVAVRTALERLDAQYPGRELSCKFILTRGQEYPPGIEGATGWAVAMLGPDYSVAREQGISVVVLSRGVPRDVMASAPWLLAGAKSLSYAINRSVIREAHRRGQDDTLFVSSDGYVLEGPTSSFLVRLGGTIVTPPAEDGVLPGTTQASAFRWFEQHGVPTATRSIRIEELDEAEAAWFTSSTRLAAPVRQLDGRALPVDPHMTAALNRFLLDRDG
ncbi:aminotransferase class IV [Raineyella fluvialis]|uniref:Aminodeoxychorismate lyase n=1 Tax=Raineyella fluvialis TaxID=2662261 RepID=A0A5Q2FI99_9ACTN|nr:aminotransferase class IV [Raineyella fluvialis]QGF24893.1 aminodeoxychorismate lyase [Raineyella fluvialis]